MPSIGSFSVAAKTIRGATTETPREPDTFDFEGETFTVIDYAPSALPMMELSDAIESGVDEDSTAALAAMYQMLQHCLAEADWPRFRKVAMKSRATLDDVMPIVNAVWEAVTGDPTRGPSASPDGPTPTSTRSGGTSRERATARRRATSPKVVEADVVEPGPSRPDLDVELISVEDALKGKATAEVKRGRTRR